MNDLEKLGFNNWFKDKADEQKLKDYEIARVVSVNKNSFMVSNGGSDIFGELTGKFLFNSESPLDLPAVGDWVYVQLFNDQSLAVIHEILPRKSLLKRKTPGKKIEYQLIAANIDTAVIMQSLDSNYNLRRLERYLVLINECGITPIVFLSKSDLADPEEIERKKEEIREIAPGITSAAFSNNNPADLERIKTYFIPGATYCLLGSSGVGKTTLLNNLLEEELFITRPVREKDDRGKHTTTKRELLILKNGPVIIDNPGMRELGVISIESGLGNTFNEIDELTQQCRFNDCTHTRETGCAVLKGIEDGVITEERYRNYIKMRKESLYNEMSYVERRQKDKKFGKYIKSVLKHKKDKR